MFFSEDFYHMHEEILSASQISEVNGVLTFNFQDPEGNMFVMAKA